MDALAALGPISDAYATLPVADAFDWSDAAHEFGDGDWYLVAFRSVRRPGADETRLTAYDDRAHLEAESAPGFVHYFKGPAGPDGSCLSFCLWTSRAEARAAAGRAHHTEAVSVVTEMYERYTLEFLRVTGRSGQPLRFESYDAPLAHTGGVPAIGLTLRPGTAPATS